MKFNQLTNQRVIFAAATLLLAIGHAQPGAALEIQFDYRFDTNHFFDTQQKRDALEAAAAQYESLIVDRLDAIVPRNPSFNQWDPTIRHPGTNELCCPGEGPDPAPFTGELANLVVPADTLIVFVGGRDLPGTSVGIGGPGGFSGSGTGSWLTTLRTRGQGVVSGADAVDVSTWGGAISFDTTRDATPVNWHFGIETGPGGGQTDFLSVALHELGHLLGLGTADSWDNQVAAGNFTGPAARALWGGNVPLNATASHWANGTMSTVFPSGAPQEAALSPSLTQGTRKWLTDLDVAALRDIGWEIESRTPAAVRGRHVFYNGSSFDGGEVLSGPADDLAIATDKTALLPGGEASLENYTSFAGGINGVMIDVADLAGAVDHDDFLFRVGNDANPDNWGVAPRPSSITLREGAGEQDSDRITIIWDDESITDQWLQVTLKAGADTGLPADDVFYFGSAVGDTGLGNLAGVVLVDGIDRAAVRDHRLGPGEADIESPYDLNRDGAIDELDRAIVRGGGANFTSGLRLLSLPGDAPGAALAGAAVPEPATGVPLAMGLLVIFARQRRRELSAG